MRVIGIITTTVVGAVVLIAVAVGARSISDFKRYIRMRGM